MGGKIMLEMYAGCSIERACEDAVRVANTLGIDVEFDFNGVRCLASPQGSSAILAERQQFEQARKPTGPFDSRKFASSTPQKGSAHDL